MGPCDGRPCAELPLRIKRLADGRTLVSGLPTPLISALLAVVLPPSDLAPAVGHVGTCSCSLKTALVPASDLDWWKDLMAFSPFGSDGGGFVELDCSRLGQRKRKRLLEEAEGGLAQGGLFTDPR